MFFLSQSAWNLLLFHANRVFGPPGGHWLLSDAAGLDRGAFDGYSPFYGVPFQRADIL